MAEERVERRLAAILAADVVGYSRLMGEDEEGTLAALTSHLSEMVEPCISEHRGRVVKTTGDGLLAEFASVVDAVQCALAVQGGMENRNSEVSANRRIVFRIGVNLGDVIVQDGDVFGDGVNVASRLEGLADPGGVCLSRAARDQVRDRMSIELEDLGEVEVKNIARPVRCFAVKLRNGNGQAACLAAVHKPAGKPSDKPSIAVLPFDNLSNDPEQDYFADGMAEDIITALSRLRWFFVIARNSTFAYRGGRHFYGAGRHCAKCGSRSRATTLRGRKPAYSKYAAGKFRRLGIGHTRPVESGTLHQRGQQPSVRSFAAGCRAES
jgi:adenylate cyclase